jgi:hypothetical protein
MLCRFAYLLVRRFLDVVSGRFRSRLAKEVEIAVLGHQIEVLRRQCAVSILSLRIGRFWRCCPGCFPGPGGRRLWSRQRRSCVDIASWCVAAGPTPSSADRPSTTTSETSSFGWRARTRAGATADRRRAPPPRHPRVREHRPAGAASGGTRSGAAPTRPELVDVSAGPGSRGAGL